MSEHTKSALTVATMKVCTTNSQECLIVVVLLVAYSTKY